MKIHIVIKHVRTGQAYTYIHSLAECIKEQIESNSVKNEEGYFMKNEAVEDINIEKKV